MNNLADPRFIVAGTLILITAILDAYVMHICVSNASLTKEAYVVIGGVLGVWHMGFAAGWGFWIGSSASSKEKDETIAHLSKP